MNLSCSTRESRPVGIKAHSLEDTIFVPFLIVVLGIVCNQCYTTDRLPNGLFVKGFAENAHERTLRESVTQIACVQASVRHLWLKIALFDCPKWINSFPLDLAVDKVEKMLSLVEVLERHTWIDRCPRP